MDESKVLRSGKVENSSWTKARSSEVGRWKLVIDERSSRCGRLWDMEDKSEPDGFADRGSTTVGILISHLLRIVGSGVSPLIAK